MLYVVMVYIRKTDTSQNETRIRIIERVFGGHRGGKGSA
jgi:hypothetical protein